MYSFAIDEASMIFLPFPGLRNSMKRKYEFPIDGWRFASSNSTGADMLYGGVSKVVVNIFSGDQLEAAASTYQHLKNLSIVSACIREVTEIDGNVALYVFAERQEFISHFPSLRILA